MQLLITGGTGFVGSHAQHHFLNQGHDVTLIGTRPAPEGLDHARCRYIRADTTASGDWQEAVGQADLILNLAGRTISKRWTARYKTQIRESRILTTRNLVAALPAASRAVLISTSAVGFYGDGGEMELAETSPGGDDFLADLSREWEAAAMDATEKGARVVIARFGIVLGRDGGPLAAMVQPFRAFMGGPIGSGRQWFPWIHMEDLLAAIQFLYDHAELHGAFNLCSPNPVRNRELAQTIGKVIGRPAVMPVPALALKLMLGEMAEAVMASQRAIPAKLLAAGFQFQYSDLEPALVDLLTTPAR
ncbi:TIGR01777 family oxidoreductase [Desulfatitalea alkaliphila]|uniref:TIGR01777 family oxidoreductase n=1 Tax=Desulfatitalea alkaliphila TaxID=2929485 RepID=A0AA41RB32_9BACT|nr:TIGR01777 family oxidoreductase [Desulfatitalea alkaliphila]MCJ8501908.1 TIGR01777 family oxidoreductase [Desulfatitalea alkaliphila]